MSRQVQQLVIVDSLRMHSRYGKLSVRKRTRFIKHHRTHLRQHIQVVRTLYQDTTTRGTADATKECQGHADNQRTGARHYQEHQRSVQPGAEGPTQQCRHNGQGDGGKHHDRRIDTGKAGNKRFALRLMFAGILNQLDNLRNRALAVGLGHAYTQHATQVYAARYHLVVLGHIAGQRFACQRHRIQRTRTVDDHTIQRHTFTWTDHNHVAHLHLIRLYALVAISQCGIVGFNLHQVCNAVATLSLGIALKQLTHLKEQHHKHRLGKLCFGPWQETYTQGTDGSNTHQEVLVKRLALQQTLSRLLQRVMPYY